MAALEQGFLVDLGARLRRLRLASGRSLSETARRAGLSRRYLTEAEAGRTNASVLVLARLAAALEVDLVELFDFDGSRSSERLALVGLRGAGKSTVGRLVARELEVPFVELDRRVEELAGLSLGEVFELHGPAVFRRLEGEALEAVLATGERLVIATSGSIVESAETFARLLATCRTVWLAAEPEEHFQRVLDQGDRRPMRERPRAMEELRALLAARSGAYARCEHVVRTSGKRADDVAREILALVAARRA
jgi:XRE family aerobic/anaerobic benzoate catabolism transcriptional regulator